MPDFNPQTLAAWISGTWDREPSSPIRGFTFDSRRAGDGDLFICLKTDRRDGHDFIGKARENGAAAALVAKRDPSVDLPQLLVDDPLRALQAAARRHREHFGGEIVGVTGTCGKTSTKDLLAHLLGQLGGVYATGGNFNNHIGVPVTLLGLDPGLSKTAVIEAGINLPGEMERLAEMIAPNHALVTLIGPAHLENLKDLPGVAREKAFLGKAVAADGSIAFPADCLCYNEFQSFTGKALIAARGKEPVEAGGRAEVFRYTSERFPDSTVLNIRTPTGGLERFELPATTDGMVRNAVLAILVAWNLGATSPGISARLRDWKPAALRGEMRRFGETVVFVDCYNANPPALQDAACFFDETADRGRPRLYLLGCMGELGSETLKMHREAGRKLPLRPGDSVCLLGAEADAFREGMLEHASGPPVDKIRICTSLDEMGEVLSGFVGYVFIKGSRVYGMERLLEWLGEGDSGGKEAAC